VLEALNIGLPLVVPAVDHVARDIERDVADVANSMNSTMIAIGDKYFTVGATKIRTDDEGWRNLFDTLASLSRAIVCEVHSSPSCLWEIRRLASSAALLEKTIFVLPPAHVLISYDQVVTAAALAGLELPDYSLDGWVFVAAPPAQLHSFRRLDDVVADF